MSDLFTPEQQAEVNRIVEARLARAKDVRVTHEPRTYGLDSPHSFYLDRANAVLRHDLRAERRLARYADEMAYEVRENTREGQYIERVIREHTRVDDAGEHERRFKELRTLTSGGGATASASGGGAAAFVTPFFVMEAWAPFAGVGRPFADQCHMLPLPAYGMEGYIPSFTATDAAGQQTEGSSVTETDPTTNYQSGQVETITGQVVMSQQLHDRGMSGGGTFDAVMGKDLGQRIEEQLDAYVLGQAITNGASVSDSTAPATATWVPNLYKDLALGREKMTDTAGVRLKPTHLFTTSDLYSYATRQVDNATAPGRPIITPIAAPGSMPPNVTGADDGLQLGGRPTWSRYTGTVMPGGVLWFEDDNIPAVSSNTQLLVSAPDQSIVLLESPECVLSVFPQTLAGNLKVVLNLRCYVVAITRFGNGTAVITGAAYPTSLV